MATAVSQHVRHLGFFKNFIFSKTAASYLAILNRKHVFTASNRNMIMKSGKEGIRANFAKKLQFSIANFNLRNFSLIVNVSTYLTPIR